MFQIRKHNLPFDVVYYMELKYKQYLCEIVGKLPPTLTPTHNFTFIQLCVAMWNFLRWYVKNKFSSSEIGLEMHEMLLTLQVFK